MTFEEFNEKYCMPCGTQRCGGIYDEVWREGCPRYREEILGEPPELNPYDYRNLIKKNEKPAYPCEDCMNRYECGVQWCCEPWFEYMKKIKGLKDKNE